jgi:hypothetical protein
MFTRTQRPISDSVRARAALSDSRLTHAARELARRSAQAQDLPEFVADPAALSAVAVILARPLTRPHAASRPARSPVRR